MIEIITSWIIPSIIMAGMIYVVYHQYGEQGRKYNNRNN